MFVRCIVWSISMKKALQFVSLSPSTFSGIIVMLPHLSFHTMPLSVLYLIHAAILTQLAAASVIPHGGTQTAAMDSPVKRDGTLFPWAVMGDSWGSGVSYNDSVLLDNNLDNCLRTWEAFGPQMHYDTSWTGSYTSNLRDAACSGSELVDLAKGDHQMGKIGEPNLLIMTAGGNNAGFGDIIEKCIYHPSTFRNYGPTYGNDPSGIGLCSIAMQAATDYIKDHMPTDLTDTLDNAFNDPAVKDNPNFLLYLTGYARFWGTDLDPWCNEHTWGLVNYRNADPYLNVALRKDMNALVTSVNTLYQTTIQSPKYAKQARYVDIDAGFAGHRFCEPGMNLDDQFGKNTKDPKVYLWNLNFDVTYSTVDPDDTAYQAGTLTADRVNTLLGSSGSSGPDQNVTAFSPSGPTNQPKNGWRLRPFHPKYSGYTTIKNALLAQMKKDGLPKAGQVASSPPSPPPQNSPAPPACDANYEGSDSKCAGKCGKGTCNLSPDPLKMDTYVCEC